MAKRQYNHQEIEQKWRHRWDELGLNKTDLNEDKESFYCLDMFPYPSGDGLHVGHWRGYVLSDFYTRYQRLRGKNVLHPMGFDSFGLPAENAAIKNKSHPAEYTQAAIKRFRSQLDQIGSSYDWDKMVVTSQPNYYRWTQWLFLQLLKHGLAEKRRSLVNWCPKDKTVLANEQVVNGCCERCGTKVTKKELDQWYFKTTEFADSLLAGLDTVDWQDHVKTLQRNWIGKSTGASVIFNSSAGPIEVFTTRVDTLFGVNALVLAPEHPLVGVLTQPDQKNQVSNYLAEVATKTNIDREQEIITEKTGVFTGSYAIHPLSQEKLPVWLADYVLTSYGTGAVMSVPAHDERDWQFAQTHNLPVKPVISPRLVQSTGSAKYRPGESQISNDGIIVFLKHPTNNKYLGLKWKTADWVTLLTGVVDEGYTSEETVLKEIKEETGYQHFKIVKTLGHVDGQFYHVPKKTNKLVHSDIFLVQLEDEEQENISADEAAKHELVWFTTDELAQTLTADTHQYCLKLLLGKWPLYTGEGSLVNSDQFSGLQTEDARKQITETLKKDNRGQTSTTYRLRDWLVSRQRYWGAPIPVVYDPEGKPHPVKDEHLPLTLPTDVDFLPGGESPIAKSKEYQELAEKLYGPGWRFDTDTLDTFVDSSWYYLRYLSPTNDQQAFDPALVKNWFPVDLYIGGIEHATLHLLYARFITQFLAKFNYIDATITEPFQRLFNIGMVNLHGAKMSKSKGNVVTADEIVEHYGTDALRGYELFLGPMDIETEWNQHGINGIYRLLIKLWQIADQLTDRDESDLDSKFNQYLGTIEPMIKDFRLNTYLSEAMKFINQVDQGQWSTSIWQQFLITLSPVFPFITEELWHQSGQTSSIFHSRWPDAKPIELGVGSELSVRLNHRHVTSITISGQESEEELVKLIKQNADLAAKIDQLANVRVIAKPDRGFVDFVG